MKKNGLYLVGLLAVLSVVWLYCRPGAVQTQTPFCERTVLIDPGHGGADGGAVGEDGTLEKHINLAVSLDLRDMLTIWGYEVSMTRETDCSLETEDGKTVHSRKLSDMKARLSLYDKAGLVISVHQNKFPQSQYKGTQVFYSKNTPLGKPLAESIQQSVVSRLQPDNHRAVKQATDGIYLLHHTKAPSVLVECGFLSNAEERERLKNGIYQQQLALAVTAGLWEMKTNDSGGTENGSEK